jgi:hypothetical protein
MRQGKELIVRERERLLYESRHLEAPRGEVHARDIAVVQHGPFLGENLPWRKAIAITRNRVDFGQEIGGHSTNIGFQAPE